MEAVRQNISDIMLLDSDVMAKLMDKLAEIGVCNVDDLIDVQLADLCPAVLLPIQARKLIRIWSSVIGTPSSDAASCTVSSNSRPIPLTPITPVNATCSTSPNWHMSFEVSKIISCMLRSDQQLATQEAAKSLTDGLALTHAQRNEVVRVVTDDILKICKTPKRLHLNTIAEIMVNKYAQLRDECDGCVVGCGYSSLRNQLECRIAYLKKPLGARKKSGVAKRLVLQDEENQPRKIVVRDGYGCIDFLPATMPDCETEESLNSKQTVLKDAYATHCWNEVDVTNMMEATYILQRQDLVGITALAVKQIQVEWPFLLEPKWMVNHLHRLLGFNILQKLEAGLLSKKQILYSYFHIKASTMKELGKQLVAVDTDSQPVISLIPLLTTYFAENLQLLLIAYEVIPDTRSEAELAMLPATPCLLMQGSELHKATIFRLVVDNTVVCSSIESPLAAIALLFGSYFLFNIQYPTDASATLEFIQRVFLNINPACGTKVERLRGKKSRSGVHEKVLSLVKDMSVSDVLNA